MVACLGWHIYLSNVPEQAYTVQQIIHTYRRQPLLERTISRLKSRNLHIRPISLHDQQRICALAWLLVLALHILVLTEFRIRREWKFRQQSILGLKSSSPAVATNRPTTERILQAFEGITWSIVSLEETQLHILDLLHLSADIYLNLNFDLSKPLFNLRE